MSALPRAPPPRVPPPPALQAPPPHAGSPLEPQAQHSERRARPRVLLLDHLVGALQQHLGHPEPECLGGPQIDGQFNLNRLLDGNIGRSLSLEHPHQQPSRLRINALKRGP
jgi:hypothetical protein